MELNINPDQIFYDQLERKEDSAMKTMVAFSSVIVLLFSVCLLIPAVEAQEGGRLGRLPRLPPRH